MTASPSLDSLLAVLAESDVEFIVVGMLAAVAQGAPITTHDIDIVHRRTPDNVAKLIDVLVHRLDARYRGHYKHVLRPTAEILMEPGHSLLQTSMGPLDVLGAIEGGRDYDALLPRAIRIELSGHPLHVLNLPTLIELKRESKREKDRIALPILEETLRRATKRPEPQRTSAWRAHPLCAPAATMPDRFWGPEQFDPTAWRELAALLSPGAEIAAILDALGDASDCIDVGGGTGLITQAIANRMPVLVIEPAAEQRAHLPPNIMVRAGRIEALPLHDGTYDASVATWVLQYTDDPMRAVSELARVARRTVVIVQAAPGNDLVDIWNLEATIAGQPHAHHGYLLSGAAELLEREGFDVTLERVGVAVSSPAGAHALADTFVRMHFSAHPKRAEMLAATEPVIAKHLATKGMVNDDAVVLRAVRS